MKTYLVGGAVRDQLLGRPCGDRDWVVVGATPEDMLQAGFRAVGEDFPVFLHPQTGEEYALARTERKVGRGYRGFVFHTDPSVSLQEDLARRDLTINAMALDDDGRLIDPWGGQLDLQARVLRHVSPAFVEDPVRILRVARFAARLADFEIAAPTRALMREMVSHGEVDHLVPERVWQELARGLMEAHPSRMLEVLQDCGALHRLLPEVAAHARAASDWRALLRRLDLAAAQQLALGGRYALLRAPAPAPHTALDNPHVGPHVDLHIDLSDDLVLDRPVRAPRECEDLAALWARHADWLRHGEMLEAAQLLALMQQCDAWRKGERYMLLIKVAEIDMSGPRADGVEPPPWAGGERLRQALATVQSLDLHRLSAQALAAGARGPAVGLYIEGARLQALQAWLARPALAVSAGASAAPSQSLSPEAVRCEKLPGSGLNPPGLGGSGRH